MDILVKLRCAYYNVNGELIDRNKDILLNYIKTWFIIDAFTILPFYILTDSTDPSIFGNYINLGASPTTLKFLKIGRIFKLFQ